VFFHVGGIEVEIEMVFFILLKIASHCRLQFRYSLAYVLYSVYVYMLLVCMYTLY